NETAKASEKNSEATIKQLQQVWDQLTKEVGTGQSIPTNLSPSRILALKRGIGDTISSWTPEARKTFNPIRRAVYGALDSELDRTVPEAAELNDKMANLIPGKQRAVVESSKAGFTQRVLGRAKAHTGALVGAGIGATAGYKHGGVGDAVLYGAAGLIGPEIVAEPSVEMAAARALNSGVLRKAAQAAGAKTLDAVIPDSWWT